MKKTILLLISFFALFQTGVAQSDSTAIDREILDQKVVQVQSKLDQLESTIDKLIKGNQSNLARIDSLDTQISNNATVAASNRVNIDSLKRGFKYTQRNLNNFQSRFKEFSHSLDTIAATSQANKSELSLTKNQLTADIQEFKSTSSNKFTMLNEQLAHNTFYWLGAFLLAVTLCIGGYVILRKHIATSKSDLNQQILATKKSLEEEGIKLDNKLVEVLDSQLKLMEEQKSEKSSGQNGEQDHSLALKVADEISRIQMNLNHMDPSVKGLKRLDRAVQSIIDNFNAKGYEIPPLLNKSYDQGMNLVATMEFDENLKEGDEYIKRVIKPQVNYKGKMIQAAEVVVAFGEG